MASKFWTFLSLLALGALISSSCSVCSHRDALFSDISDPTTSKEAKPRQKDYELEFREAQEELQYEGGSIRIWRKDVPTFSDKHLDVAEIIFEEDGLMLPQYADADGISYVLQGTGKVGVVASYEGGLPCLSMRRVEPGDVIAIPKGIVFWWYNDGYGKHKIFCASDTSDGVNPGQYNQFNLVGAKQQRFGGLLHGFSPGALATAWDVDEAMVLRLLASQNGTTMIKSPTRIRLPDPRGLKWAFLRGLRIGANTGAEELDSSDSRFSEFRYNLDKEYPDIYVQRGGWKKVADENHLHVLKLVDMSAVRMGLEKGAMEAPVFFPNANQLIYIIQGSGHIEVSSNDGKSLLVTEVQKGSVLAIPRYLPSIKVAGDEGLSFVSFLTSSKPLPSYLVGRNSFDEGVPAQVLAEAFDVDEDMLMQARQARKHDEVIFPPTTYM